MIFFKAESDRVVLVYVPNKQPENWLIEKIERKSPIILSKTFQLSIEIFIEDHEINDEDDQIGIRYFEVKPACFLFAEKIGNYYKVSNGVLINRFAVYLGEEFVFDTDCFIVDFDISIFKTLEPLLTRDLYIGGDDPTAMPFAVFTQLLHAFPKAWEKKLYIQSRVAAVVRDGYEFLKGAEKSYQNYMNKRC